MFLEYEFKIKEMKIDYKIEEVKPNIFAVVVPDGYHRAMLFCRVQEYYESPNPQFRGKNFSIWDYIEWYSREHNNTFTYTSDWSGFNIPLKTAWDCYDKLREHETPYDEVMDYIARSVEMKMFFKKNTRNWKAYIIGTGDTTGWTFQHEVCHGLYYTNKEYKKIVDEQTKAIDKKHYNIFKKNLLKMGYTDLVIDDEIQAYLQYGWESDEFGKGVPLEIREMYNSWYEDELINFKK